MRTDLSNDRNFHGAGGCAVFIATDGTRYEVSTLRNEFIAEPKAGDPQRATVWVHKSKPWPPGLTATGHFDDWIEAIITTTDRPKSARCGRDDVWRVRGKVVKSDLDCIWNGYRVEYTKDSS